MQSWALFFPVAGPGGVCRRKKPGATLAAALVLLYTVQYLLERTFCRWATALILRLRRRLFFELVPWSGDQLDSPNVE